MEDERYLYACGLYIEYNPVEAGLVNRPEEWLYSSSRYYFAGESDDLVSRYGELQLPEGINLRSKEIFENGDVIGSELFKFYREGELSEAH